MLGRLFVWVLGWRVRRKERALRKQNSREVVDRVAKRYAEDTAELARITLHDDLSPQSAAQFGQAAPWWAYDSRGGDA